MVEDYRACVVSTLSMPPPFLPPQIALAEQALRDQEELALQVAAAHAAAARPPAAAVSSPSAAGSAAPVDNKGPVSGLLLGASTLPVSAAPAEASVSTGAPVDGPALGPSTGEVGGGRGDCKSRARESSVAWAVIRGIVCLCYCFTALRYRGYKVQAHTYTHMHTYPHFCFVFYWFACCITTRCQRYTTPAEHVGSSLTLLCSCQL